MTIVDQTPVPAVEAKRDSMRAAALVLAELLERDLPLANLSIQRGTGNVAVSAYAYTPAEYATLRADFEAWMDALDIAEYSETEKTSSEMKLEATGIYKGVTIAVSLGFFGARRTATKKRTVSR